MSLLDLDQYEDAIYDNLPRMKVRRGERTAATMAKNHLVLAIALIAASGRNQNI